MLLACCTHILGNYALPLQTHGPLARRNTVVKHRRDLPAIFGGLGGATADEPTDGEAEQEPAGLRPTGTTRGDGASFSAFSLFPGILPATLESGTAKSKETASSNVRSASASATPESRLATTTQPAPVAALMTGSAATALAQPTQDKDKPDRMPSSSSASSSDSWKIIGVAVICFIAVVVVLVVAVFFDTWWHFVRDLFRSRRAGEQEEMVPDWHKASWEVRLGDRQRYPSFGSVPASPVLRGDPLQRQRSLRVQEWQKEDVAPAPAMTPAERLAQYPAVPPSAYVSPDPRPNPGSIDPFKDRSPSLSPGMQELHKDPFHDARTYPYDGIKNK